MTDEQRTKCMLLDICVEASSEPKFGFYIARGGNVLARRTDPIRPSLIARFPTIDEAIESYAANPENYKWI